MATLFAPTLVGTIYGMWGPAATPFAILLMAVVCVSLYVIFKKRDWL